MLHARFRAASIAAIFPSLEFKADDGSSSSNRSGTRSLRGKRNFIALGVVSIFLLGLLLFSLGALGPAASSASITTTTSTSYNVAASSVITSVATHAPDGYAQDSSKQLNPNESGLANGGYGTFSAQDGSLANMTILVFDTPQSAQTYINSVISNEKDLSGYTDISAVLASYQHYGVCYGFGETDPEGNGAIATGVCTKGNIYIQVHVVSPASLPSAEGVMSDFVGAAYQSIG